MMWSEIDVGLPRVLRRMTAFSTPRAPDVCRWLCQGPRRPRRGLSYLVRRERDGRPQWSSSYAKCHGHDLFQHDGDLGESTDRDGVNGGAYVWARLCSHAAATTCSN